MQSVDPDQTPHSAMSDLCLHCLPMFLLWDARLNGLRVLIPLVDILYFFFFFFFYKWDIFWDFLFDFLHKPFLKRSVHRICLLPFRVENEQLHLASWWCNEKWQLNDKLCGPWSDSPFAASDLDLHGKYWKLHKVWFLFMFSVVT